MAEDYFEEFQGDDFLNEEYEPEAEVESSEENVKQEEETPKSVASETEIKSGQGKNLLIIGGLVALAFLLLNKGE